MSDDALKIFVKGSAYDLSQIVSVQNPENSTAAMAEALAKAVVEIEEATGDLAEASLATAED